MNLQTVKQYAEKKKNDAPMSKAPGILLNLQRERYASDARKVMEITTDAAVRDAIGRWLATMNDRENCKYTGEQMLHALLEARDFHKEKNDGCPFVPHYQRLLNQSNLVMYVPDDPAADTTRLMNLVEEIRRTIFVWDVKDVAERCDDKRIKAAAAAWLANWDDVEHSMIDGPKLYSVLIEVRNECRTKEGGSPFLADYERLVSHQDLLCKHVLDAGEEFHRAVTLTADLRRQLLKADLAHVVAVTTCSHVRESGQALLDVWEDENATVVAGAEFIPNLKGGLKYHLKHKDGHEFNADYLRLLESNHLYMKKPMHRGEEFTRAMNLANALRRDVLRKEIEYILPKVEDQGFKAAAEALIAVWEEPEKSQEAAIEFVTALKMVLKNSVDTGDNDPFNADYQRILDHMDQMAKKPICLDEEVNRALNLILKLRRENMRAKMNYVAAVCTCGSVKDGLSRWLTDYAYKQNGGVEEALELARSLKGSIDYHIKHQDGHKYLEDYQNLLEDVDIFALPDIQTYGANISLLDRREALLADAKQVAERTDDAEVREAIEAWLALSEDKNACRGAAKAMTVALKQGVIRCAVAKNAEPVSDYLRILGQSLLFTKKDETEYLRDIAQMLEHGLYAADCASVFYQTASETLKAELYRWMKTFDTAASAGEVMILRDALEDAIQEGKKTEDPCVPDYRRLKAKVAASVRKQYNDGFPLDNEWDVFVSFRRALLAADIGDMALRTNCSSTRAGAREYLKVWHDPLKSAAAGDKFVEVLKGGTIYHYKTHDGHPYTVDYERIMAYHDLLGMRTPFGYMVDLTRALERGLLAMDAAEVREVTNCQSTKAGITAWLHAWDTPYAATAGAYMKDKIIGGVKYHYKYQDGHKWLADYERILNHEKLFPFYPRCLDQGGMNYGPDAMISFMRALMAADLRDVAKRTSCGNIKAAVAAYLKVWDNAAASVEAGPALARAIMGAVEYHYVARDGHKYNADYERVLSYRDLYVMKSPIDYMRQFAQVLESCLTGVRKLRGGTAERISGSQLAYYMNVANKIDDTGADELTDVLSYRRAVMMADFNDTAKRTTCGSIKKCEELFLKRWNEKEFHQETADEFNESLHGCTGYHYMHMDKHSFVRDYERIRIYKDLFAPMTVEQTMAWYTQVINRGLLAVDILRVYEICQCGHTREGAADWLRGWEKATVTKEEAERMEKYLRESMEYHVNKQDGNPFIPDYERFLARRGLYEMIPAAELPIAEPDQLYYDFMRALQAADTWSVGVRANCIHIKEGVRNFLNGYLEMDNCPAGADSIISELKSGVRYHYTHLDDHKYNGEYERLQARAVYFDLKSSVEEFYTEIGKAMDKLL